MNKNDMTDKGLCALVALLVASPYALAALEEREL